jgi:hypothetical protein
MVPSCCGGRASFVAKRSIPAVSSRILTWVGLAAGIGQRWRCESLDQGGELDRDVVDLDRQLALLLMQTLPRRRLSWSEAV